MIELTLGDGFFSGPQQTVEAFGDTLDGVGFWVPDRNPTGAGIGMISYDGWVRIGLMLDSGLIGHKKDVSSIIII